MLGEVKVLFSHYIAGRCQGGTWVSLTLEATLLPLHTVAHFQNQPCRAMCSTDSDLGNAELMFRLLSQKIAL